MTVSPTSTIAGRLAAFIALLIAIAVLPLATANAQAERVVIDFDLLADGPSDPVQASVLFSRHTFATADEALIATSFDGADALASGSLQSGVGDAAATDAEGVAVTGRPLFFVDPMAGPEPALLEELNRLGVSSLILLGGEGALPPEVVTAFNDAGFTEIQRQGGTTRIGTAALIAEYVVANSETTTAYLSRAFGTADNRDTAYADASALGGWAAATGNPILLTDTETLSLETSLFLQQGDIERVEIIGGPAAVSAEVEQELLDLDLDVARIDGATRDQTATAIADARGAGDADNAPRVIVTEGYASGYFVNAFAAAAHSGLYDAPVLLSNGDDLAPATEGYLATASFAIAEAGLVGLCGTDVPLGPCGDVAGSLDATLSSVTLASVEPTPTPTPTEEGPAETVGDLQVDPREDSTVQVSIGEDRPAGDTDDAVTYTASGLDPEAFYRITLVADANITIDGEAATFVDADDSTPETEENDGLGNGTADAGASEEVALITAVNGEDIDPAKTTPAGDDDPAEPTAHAPDDEGVLTFTVDAVDDAEGGTVHPVVYVNAGESTFLEVDDDGVPTESYGVGGAFVATAVIGDLDVSDHGPSTVTVDVLGGNDGGTDDERTYVVSGLDDETAYRISLFLDSNITYNDDQSEAIFALATDEEDVPDGTAEQGDTALIATIISVNGEEYVADADNAEGTTAPTGTDDPAEPTGIFPVDGVITFVIDGTDTTVNQVNQGGTVRPVVFVNGGTSTQLEVDAEGAPTEIYGVGGAFTTVFLP